MATQHIPKGLLVLAFFIVLGVFLGNEWISREIKQAGQLPPSAVSAVSATAPQAKDVRTGGQNLVRSESRIMSIKAQIEPPDPEEEQKKARKQKRIFEKPLDTKDLVQ